MKINDEVLQNYLHDLVIILIDEAKQAKELRQKETKDYSYYDGYLMGFHRILTIMMQQAEAFQIPLKKLGLDKIDPYKELL